MSCFGQVITSSKPEFHTVLSKDERKRFFHTDSEDTGKEITTSVHVKACIRDAKSVSLIEGLDVDRDVENLP